ncbi:YfdQ family protein [Klebsiella pneumoniae subsp. pneumoniae]|nr:YfdQ family protein [Klebsiella pneumoniae subsp. pneumoniae]
MKALPCTTSAIPVAATLKTNTDIPSVVVPDGFDIKSLESLQSAPYRIRQNTNLISPGSLIAYIQRFRDARSVVFLLTRPKPGSSRCWTSTRNADNPHWGMHKAVYDCPFSDDWKAWVGSDGNKMNQIDFAEFLENNIQNIAPISDNYKGPSGTDLLEMVLAFQETRKD